VSFCTHCGLALRPVPEGRLTQPREERRRVSVLFIDVIGSTPFAEQTDPENVRAHQTDFFGTVRRIVRQYGGVVEKYIGDAVMVLFGAPVATETDAVRCVLAGLDLQRALVRSADEAGWAFRVGIATGEALVDVSAAHDGGQAILAGDVVNCAARLQSEAPAGGVLVCDTTHLATRTEIRFAEQSALTLRGRSAPTEVWLALAPVQQQADEHSDVIPMVGRDHELGLLTSALHHVIRERTPRLVTILGRAGIGKSRLVRELYHHARHLVDIQVSWRSGRCPPFGENVAYAALADIVKAQAGVLATDTPQTARDRLDAALRDLVADGESARLSDALRPLFGVAGSPLSTEDAESAWRRFLLALGRQGPTVLVFEDLHWADERMIRFIELIATTVRDVPLLVICTARPELIDREPTWAGAVPGMSLSLTPLREDSIATLYAKMFSQAVFPPELLRQLVELADGMPLYAHEYGRMLVERGTLRQAEHSWVMEPSGELPMPESVHAVIANRIDLLDVDERAVLQAAAVVGARFWPGAVAAALRTSGEAVDRALRTLAQRDLVREQPDSTMADEPEYRFRHVLVSDVCYERLPLAERVARHTRTADWLDARVDSRGTELAEVVAHHRFTAYRTARSLGLDASPYAAPALASLLHAARRAAMLNAFDAAATHVALANQLVVSGHTDVNGDRDRLGVELLGIELALHSDAAAFLTGPGPDRLAELANLLYRVRDHGGAARAWTLLGQIAWQRADRAEALRCLDRAVELFDDWPDTPEKAQAYAELGRLHMLNYEHAPALGATHIAAEIADRLGLVELRANALITTSMTRYQAGEPDGLVDLQEALEFCRTHQLPSLRRATHDVAHAFREEGDRVRSETLLREVGGPVGGGLVVGGLMVGGGTVHSADAIQALFVGDWDHFFALADLFLNTPTAEWNLQIRGVRGWMRALRGDARGAEEDVAQALRTARSSGFWRLKWTALAHSALCHAVLDQPDESAAMLRELGQGWRRMRTIASAEWVAAAAHAATLLGEGAADLLGEALTDAPHQTAWSRAAICSLNGTLAAARGDYTTAALAHLDAAERYAAAGSATDRFLALGGALRARSAAGDTHIHISADRWAAARAELTTFAGRNHIIAAH
jgi:class 3 adenylate cyclase/tetratricopeptide (TPR) repeat protein